MLAGHPKLRNDLRKDNMEEIGARTDVFSLDGIAGAQREYIEWLLRTCTGNEDACETILTDDAIDLLASKLRTPLQVQLHLTLTLEAGYQTGERPVSVAVVESVLSRHIDDLEPTLTRNGYRMKDLVEQFNAKHTNSSRCLTIRWTPNGRASRVTRCSRPAFHCEAKPPSVICR